MEPIAIIGTGCRFPGAFDIESFWQLLCQGIDAIAEVPPERWNINTFYDPEPAKPGKINSRWGGFLEQVDRFDPQFFGISPREAEYIDPQQRLMLEVTWEALENAGLVPEKLSGSQTGVFVGINGSDYDRLGCRNFDNLCAYNGTGSAPGIAANRISYSLNLRGPSVGLDTACSSSLVAVHLACQSLRSIESDLCLVGGVNLMLWPGPSIIFSQAQMTAADGRCKTFDASADGYVRGEGCGVVVLKRLKDALDDGDNIQAIIRGSAVNQDGASNGLTAPNGPSQQMVIRQALKNAGVTPAQISYVEAHGTGTSLGDPIEVKSLKAVLMEDRDPDSSCWIGSVKTNIGHLEAAAGIAGLIKVILQLQQGEIFPHLHLKQLNPYIRLQETPLSIPTQRQSWSVRGSRFAGVSSFGFGGTNCHVILEEAPSPTPVVSEVSDVERPWHLLTLSAKTEKALQELVTSYQQYLENHPELAIADICFTSHTGRSHFNHRLAVITSDQEELAAQLAKISEGEEFNGVFSGQLPSNNKAPKIAFLFTGQGSQYINMGRQLYCTQPVFRRTLDQCEQILQSYLEKSILDVIYPENTKELNNFVIDQTAYTQPALFAIEYALTQLWQSWGIQPDVVMGHSVGEYVAATISGVFSLEDGLKLIAHRSRLMQQLPDGGEMVAVMASEEKVNQLIAPYRDKVVIAAINGPQSVVISGASEAVGIVKEIFEEAGIKIKKLQVSHAFHSPLMEPILADFEVVANQITYHQPQIPLISNITGTKADETIAIASYWVNHVRQPVKFAQSMETLHQAGYEIFLEIGPKPILLGMGRRCLPGDVGIWLPSLRPGQADWQQMLQSLTELYVQGVKVDWSGFEQDYARSKVVLPTYPFQRQRYWVEVSENGHQKAGTLSLQKAQTPIFNLLNQGNSEQLAQHLETAEKLSEEEVKLLPKLLELLVEQHQQQLTKSFIEDWLYEVEWQPKPRILKTALERTQASEPSSWLILADPGGVGQTLAELLREQGHSCLLVYAGDTYQAKENGAWSLNPSIPDDFKRLFQEDWATSQPPLRGVIHLWSLEAASPDALTVSSLEQAQALGCGSALHLVQSLVKHHKLASPRLWLVTRGAVPVGQSLAAVAQAPLWGLGKVIALEHPEFWGGMLDLAPETTGDEAAMLLTEIEDSQGEDHLAFREGQRYVARLMRSQPSENQELQLCSDSTYLITGGLGALGHKVARWMVEQGVRHLVLTGRRGASSQAREAITSMERAGAKVLVAQANVTNQEELFRMLEKVQASMPPLRGIVHAAGILDDGILLQQNWARFQQVMASKVQGTWNLHILTQQLSLDFFVMFSSAAALLGSPGQGNYSAANAFMDTLAHYRQSQGLPGLSINWGPWDDAGMAASLTSSYQKRMATGGLNAIAPNQGLQVLKQVLGQTTAQVGVLLVDWSVFGQQFPSDISLPLLSELVHETRPQEQAEQGLNQRYELLQRLEEAPDSDRQNILVSHLQNEVAQVLQMTASQINWQQPLNTMGLDSLMAVELRNRVQTDLAVDVPIVKFIEDISIVDLATEVNGQLTQIDRNQGVEQDEDQQTLLTEVKDSNWIEVVL
ncbi:MAG: type I polyketide synthase [Xenococcus sp. MO_188.B8]|nr:type I polyketide synthase [Xenococcus sp. MO_188.B8]